MRKGILGRHQECKSLHSGNGKVENRPQILNWLIPTFLAQTKKSERLFVQFKKLKICSKKFYLQIDKMFKSWKQLILSLAIGYRLSIGTSLIISVILLLIIYLNLANFGEHIFEFGKTKKLLLHNVLLLCVFCHRGTNRGCC